MKKKAAQFFSRSIPEAAPARHSFAFFLTLVSAGASAAGAQQEFGIGVLDQ